MGCPRRILAAEIVCWSGFVAATHPVSREHGGDVRSQEDAGNGELPTTGISGRSFATILASFDGTKIIV